MGSSSSKPAAARKLADHATSSLRAAPGASQASRPANLPPRPPPPTPRAGAAAEPGADMAARLQEAARRAGVGGADRFASAPPRSDARGASDRKDQGIINDAADPDFLRNLTKLGQVQVPKNKVAFRPTDHTLHILRARERDNATTDATSASASGSAAGATTTSHAANPEGHPTAAPNRLTASEIASLLDERKAAKTRAELASVARGYDVDESLVERVALRFNSVSVQPRRGADGQEERLEVKEGEDSPVKVDAVWVEPTIGAEASLPRPEAQTS